MSDTAQSSQELTDLLSRFGVSYPNSPQPTPALMAFLNGIGLSMSSAEDLKRRAIERIGAATSDAMADIDRSAGRTKQNITGDLIRRGVLSSGEANTRYARQAEDVAVRRKDLARTKASAEEDATTALQQTQQNVRMQALDRVIAAEQDQSTAAAVAKANKENNDRQLALLEQQNTAQSEAEQKRLDAELAAINQAGQAGVAV